MQLDRKVLGFGQLPSTKGDLYAPASGRKAFVHNIILHNTNTTAETVVLNYHDGTSEYEIFNQSLSAGETVIWDFKGAGDVVEDGGKYTGNTDTASKVTFKIDGTEESPSGSSLSVVGANLWAPPVTPHPMDDEFDGANLDDWGVQNISTFGAASFSLGAVNAYDTSFTSGNVVRAQLGARKSWALFQPPAGSQTFAVYKSYTLPTNLLMWARMRVNLEANSALNNDNAVMLSFMKSDGGAPNADARVNIYLNESDAGAIQAQSEYWNDGAGGATSFVEFSNVSFQGQALEYVAIHKIGTTYHTWVGTNAGNWIWGASYSSLNFTPDMVGFAFKNLTSGGNYPGVHGIDFIRFIETDKFLL